MNLEWPLHILVTYTLYALPTCTTFTLSLCMVMDWGQTLYIKISSSLLGLLGHSTFRFEEEVGVKDHMQEMVSNFFVNPIHSPIVF